MSKRRINPNGPLEDRLFSSILVDPSGCLIWVGARMVPTRGGYGQFGATTNGQYKNWRAHRFVYERTRGPIPEEMVLDHLCKKPECVNPSHLEVVTRRENTLRGTNPAAQHARKTHCIRGHKLPTERDKQGVRVCRTCKNMRQRIAWTKRKVSHVEK